MLSGRTKQAFYKKNEERLMQSAAMRAFALEYAEGIRAEDPGIGMMKLWYMYQHEFRAQECILGRDRFCDLLAEHGMKVRQKVRKPRTTDSTHGLPTYPDIVKEFIPTAPNQLWVSDITYITIWVDAEHYVFCYLSLVMDAYTKEIVGWAVGDSLRADFPIAALKTALKRIEGKEHTLIHHSDRGVQYASAEYVKLLTKHNIRISMTETGDPKDNAQAERINNTMKNELLKGITFHSIKEVQAAVAAAVDFYNNRRPHMSIDMMTPAEAAAMTGRLDKKWTSWREKAIEEKECLAPCIGYP